MGEAPPVNALTAFIPCDRHHNTRSAEVWSKSKGTRTLLLSLCQHDADRHAVAMWEQGFRPIMKAPRDPSTDDCDTEVVK